MDNDRRIGCYDDSEPGLEPFPGIPKTGTILCLALNDQAYEERRRQIKIFKKTKEEKSALIRIRTEEEVYEIVKPSKQVVLKGPDGRTFTEEITFGRIEDFEPDSIVRRIPHQARGDNLEANVTSVLAQIRGMEKAYRTLNLYFRNARCGDRPLDHFHILNLKPRELASERWARDMLIKEITQRNHTFGMACRISTLVLPEAIETNALKEIVRTLNDRTYGVGELKVHVIGTTIDAETVDDFMDHIKKDNPKGNETYLSWLTMTGNYLCPRGQVRP